MMSSSSRVYQINKRGDLQGEESHAWETAGGESKGRKLGFAAGAVCLFVVCFHVLNIDNHSNIFQEGGVFFHQGCACVQAEYKAPVKAQ